MHASVKEEAPCKNTQHVSVSIALYDKLKALVSRLQIQDPCKAAAAEQVLLQFRKSPRPLAACRQLLDCSPYVEARFHAACTLREALVREWAAMGQEEVRKGARSGISGRAPMTTVITSAFKRGGR